MTLKSEWVWYGQPGHFCAHRKCRFHLTTEVGRYLVSTVGQYVQDLRSNSDTFDEIGLDRKYETMVFKWRGRCNVKDNPDCGNCGLPETDSNYIDFEPYNSAGDARRGHLKMCLKWAKRKRP